MRPRVRRATMDQKRTAYMNPAADPLGWSRGVVGDHREPIRTPKGGLS
jgi:hypothetical protein